MEKLWIANIIRLKKSKALWIYTVLIFVITVWYITKGWSVIGLQHTTDGLNNCIVFIAGAVPAFLTLFVGFFLGTEYSNKTIRNKIVAGYTRKEIYLAYLFTAYAAMGVFMAAWFAGTIAGILLCGYGTDWQGLMGITVLSLFFSTSFVSFLVFISVMFQNKALAIIIQVEFARLSLMIPLIGSTIGNEDSGMIGKGINLLLQLLPMSQWMYATNMLEVPAVSTVISVCMSLVVIVLLAVFGTGMFEKKEIK